MVADKIGVREDDASREEDGSPTAVSAFDPSLRKIWPRLISKLGSTGRLLDHTMD